MPDFSSSRIEGITERDRDRDLPEREERRKKSPPRTEQKLRLADEAKVEPEAFEQHDLDEMA